MPSPLFTCTPCTYEDGRHGAREAHGAHEADGAHEDHGAHEPHGAHEAQGTHGVHEVHEAHEAQKKRENRRRPKDWPRSPAEWKRLTRQEQDAWYKKNRPSWWVSSNVRTYWTQPNFPKVQAKPEAEVGTVIGLTEEEVERIRLEARLEREVLINSCYAAAAEQT